MSLYWGVRYFLTANIAWFLFIYPIAQNIFTKYDGWGVVFSKSNFYKKQIKRNKYEMQNIETVIKYIKIYLYIKKTILCSLYLTLIFKFFDKHFFLSKKKKNLKLSDSVIMRKLTSLIKNDLNTIINLYILLLIKGKKCLVLPIFIPIFNLITLIRKDLNKIINLFMKFQTKTKNFLTLVIFTPAYYLINLIQIDLNKTLGLFINTTTTMTKSKLYKMCNFLTKFIYINIATQTNVENKYVFKFIKQTHKIFSTIIKNQYIIKIKFVLAILYEIANPRFKKATIYIKAKNIFLTGCTKARQFLSKCVSFFLT